MTTQAEFGIETHRPTTVLQTWLGQTGVCKHHKTVCNGSSVHPLQSQSLNLVIGNTCMEPWPLVRNMLRTLETITFASDYSAKRMLAFQEFLRQDVLVREDMKTCKAKTFVQTMMGRWGWFFLHFSDILPCGSTVTSASFKRWRWEGKGVFVFHQTIWFHHHPFCYWACIF